MAIPGRRNGHDLIADLKEKPYRFQFFQAVRLLLLAEKAAGRPAAMPKGLRFRTPASLAFPASEISQFKLRGQTSPSEAVETGQDNKTGDEAAAMEMEVSFLGLTGPSGVLPSFYTEFLIERRGAHRDLAAHEFLDIFSHRLISLFYGAWEKYRFFVGYEQGKRDGFTKHLLDLLGTGKPNRNSEGDKEGPVPPQVLAFFSGSLGRRPLPSSNLVAVIGSYFGVKVQLKQFVGQWIEAPGSEQSCIGKGNCALGESTFLGARMWDQQTKIRLRIGPLSREKFGSFQPGRSAAIALRHLVETCVGQSLNCDVTLVLAKDAISPPVMSADSEEPLRLGLNVWMRSIPTDRDLDDVCFKLL